MTVSRSNVNIGDLGLQRAPREEKLSVFSPNRSLGVPYAQMTTDHVDGTTPMLERRHVNCGDR